MTDTIQAVQAKPAEKHPQQELIDTILDQRNWYMSFYDEDAEVDGFMHLVSTYNGRELKIRFEDLAKGLEAVGYKVSKK